MKYFFTLVIIMSISACSNQLEPTGTGNHLNDLKRSPCACYELKRG